MLQPTYTRTRRPSYLGSNWCLSGPQVITFVAAIVLLFSRATGIALTAGLMAILTVLAGATLRMGGRTESKTA